MANVKIPERYSHDKLRDRLQTLESIALQVDRCILDEDFEKAQHFWNLHRDACKEFKEAFEEHDVEMQFVDRLVEEHKHEQIVNKNWSQKWAYIQKIGLAAGAITAVISLYMMFK